MTWAAVRAQIAAIVEGVTPHTGNLYGEAFRHVPEADDDNLPDHRGFYFRTLAGSGVGPYLPNGGNTRHRVTVLLSVVYPGDDLDPAALDEAIEIDRVALTSALLNTQNWNQATTKIDSLTEGEKLLLQTRQRDVGPARVLTFEFPVRYRT